MTINPPGFARCLAAMLYECLLLAGVLAFCWLLPQIMLPALAQVVPPRWVGNLHFFLLLLFYFVWFWHKAGQTLAMRTWRLRVVDKSGQPLRLAQAIFRYCAAWMSLLLLGMGFFWRLFDPEKQFLHDRLADSRLILDDRKADSA
ncbi:MAG: RDD family protein [Zoogloeaceae bacterium]|jgi:uncharacterized RDD family membrane protein YckC|nr:RDD family protein [Zoogloeaceae bacterium]